MTRLSPIPEEPEAPIDAFDVADQLRNEIGAASPGMTPYLAVELTPLPRATLRTPAEHQPPIMPPRPQFTQPAAPRFSLNLRGCIRWFSTRTDALQLGVNVAVGATAGTLAGVGGKGIELAWAPLLTFASNDALKAYNFEPTNNKFLVDYYGTTNFTDPIYASRQASERTRAYFKEQAVFSGAVATLSTVGSIGGHFDQAVGWTMNSFIHAIPAGTTIYTLSRLFWYARHNRTGSAQLDNLLNLIAGLKATRVALHGVLTASPGLPAIGSLGATAATVGIGLASNAALAEYIETTAQFVHFEAYKEQGYLVQASDLVFHDGPEPRWEWRPPATVNVLHRAGAGPATRLIELLFEDDLRRVESNLVGELIKEPAGWMAIAHKISLA